MLSFIKGSLISAKNGTVVLENNGIGYEFSVATSTLVKVSSQAEKGSSIVLLFACKGRQHNSLRLLQP